jgi:hypothetical protein
MIEQVVDPRFLRDRAKELAAESELAPVRPPGGLLAFGMLPYRRDEPFIPREVRQSQLQSALEEGLRTEEGPSVGALPTPDPCGPSKPSDASDRGANETLEGRFGDYDPRWLVTILADIQTKFRGKHPFSDAPVEFPLSDSARVLLVSDWATGLRGAVSVAARMREKVVEGLAAGRDVHVVHLGDVYYSGRPSEYLERFLKRWPVHVEDVAQAHSWNLMGNHDIYSGGHGYFEVIGGSLAVDGEIDPRSSLFANQAGCSYFRLANEHWQILGLDTAYVDQELAPPQLAWVKERLAHPQAANTMILSHHQLDSVYDRARVKRALQTALDEDLRNRRVDAWFWGHEHRCIRYHEFSGVRYPRCIGNGGVPELVEPTLKSTAKRIGERVGALFKQRRLAPPPRIISEDTQTWAAQGVNWRRHGFVCLDLAGPNIHAAYIDQCGHPFWTETLTGTS